MWVYVRKFVFPVQIRFLSNMKERIEQMIAAGGIEPQEKMWKKSNSIIIHIMRVDGGHIDEHKAWIELLH